MTVKAESLPARPAARWSDRLLILLFAVFILLPVTLHLTGVAQTTARDEMRNLVQRPRLPMTLDAWRSFGSQIDSYVSDHFGLRPYLLAAANRLNFAVRLPGGGNRVALLGKDDWLYWRNDIEQHSGLKLLGQWEIDAWTRSLDHLHDWLASQGIRFVFVIAPDKSEIYPEHLPDGVPAAPFTALDQLAAALSAQKKFDFIDLRLLLKAAKSQGQLYYKTDSHWNSLGAHLALERVLQGRLPPGDALPAFADYNLDPKPFAGDLVQLLGLSCCISEPRGELVRKFPDPVKDSGFAVKDGQEARWVDTTHRDLPPIFVYGDSFSDAWLAPLSDVASRVVYRRNDHPLHASEVLAEKPGLFIYEIVQRRVSEPPQPLVSP
jgi:alginate O-acetyltransferase complex protein AlgJ